MVMIGAFDIPNEREKNHTQNNISSPNLSLEVPKGAFSMIDMLRRSNIHFYARVMCTFTPVFCTLSYRSDQCIGRGTDNK